MSDARARVLEYAPSAMKNGKPDPRLALYYLRAEKFTKLDVFK